jgi:hypothetical protein
MNWVFRTLRAASAALALSAVTATGALAQATINNAECIAANINGLPTATQNSQFIFRCTATAASPNVLVNLPGVGSPVAVVITGSPLTDPEAGAGLGPNFVFPMQQDPLVANGFWTIVASNRMGAAAPNGGAPGMNPVTKFWSIIARDSSTGGVFMNGVNASPKPSSQLLILDANTATTAGQIMPLDENGLPDKRAIVGQQGNGLRINPLDPSRFNDGGSSHVYTWRVRVRTPAGMVPTPMYSRRNQYIWRDARLLMDGPPPPFLPQYVGSPQYNARFNSGVYLMLVPPGADPVNGAIPVPMEDEGGMPYKSVDTLWGSANSPIALYNADNSFSSGRIFRFRMAPTQYTVNHGTLFGEGPWTAFGGPTLPDSLPAIPVGMGAGSDSEVRPGVEVIGRPFANLYTAFAGPDAQVPGLGTAPLPFPNYTAVANRAGQWRYYYKYNLDLRPPTRAGFPANFTNQEDRPGADPGAYTSSTYDSDTGLQPPDPTQPYNHPRVTPILSDGGWTDDLPQNGYAGTNNPSHRSRVTNRTLVRFMCKVTKDTSTPLPAGAVKVWISDPISGNGTPFTAYNMLPVSGSPNFTTGALYYFDTSFPNTNGRRAIYFEVDDGVNKAIWPRRENGSIDGRYPDIQAQSFPATFTAPVVFGTGQVGINYLLEPWVNSKPVLSNPSVSPASGNATGQYTYRVTYTDADNDEPVEAQVVIDGQPHNMTPVNLNAPSGGREYQFTLTGITNTYGDNTHNYFFRFRDNWNKFEAYNISVARREYGEWVTLPSGQYPDLPTTPANQVNPPSVFPGPTITDNTAPELIDPDFFASDQANTTATLYDFVVRYRDVNNDAPTSIKVFLSSDNGATYPLSYTLAKAENSNNYVGGVQYHLPNRVTLPQSTGGIHYRFKFEATDGQAITTVLRVGTGATSVQDNSAATMTSVGGSNTVFTEPNLSRLTWTNAPAFFVWKINGTTPTLLVQGVDYIVNLGARTITLAVGLSAGETLRASYYYNEYLGPLVKPNTAPTLTEPNPGTVSSNNGTLSPLSGQPSDTYTYSVIYTDADNQAPTDIRVVIDTVNPTPPLTLVRDPSLTPPIDYTRGVRYSITLPGSHASLGVGSHKYHFEASDGSDIARLPSAAANPNEYTGPSIADIGGLLITDPGGAPLASIVPFPKGKHNDQYTFTVRYKNASGLAPAFPIELRVQKVGSATVTALPMSPVGPIGPTQYMTGVDYQIQLTAQAVATPTQPLEPGTFDITYGFHGLPAGTTTQVLTVNGRPVLDNQIATPNPASQAGDIDIKVRYTDVNGDAPQRAGIVLTLPSDPGVTIPTPTTVPPNPTAADFRNGVIYTWTFQAKNIPVGAHPYSITAQDDLEDSVDNGAVQQPVTGNFTIVAPGTPVLVAVPGTPTLNPTAGPVSGTYTFCVRWQHPDKVPPSRIQVILDPGANQVVKNMTPKNLPQPATGDNAWATGVDYVYTTAPNEIPAGVHTYRFDAEDRIPSVVTLPASGTFPGPSVNAAPSLSNGTAYIVPASTFPTVGGSNALNPAVSGSVKNQYKFRVTYTDPDGTAPPAGGYVRVQVAGNTPSTFTMTPVAGDPLNYAAGVVYETAALTLQPGDKTFYFEASDSQDTARFPSGTASITGLTVRNVVDLQGIGASVAPTSGPISTTFKYSITYINADNTAPAYVRLFIDEGSPNAVVADMTKVTPGNNYAAGVVYEYNFRFPIDETATSHTFRFEAQDSVTTDYIGKFPADGSLIAGPTLNIAKFDQVTFNPAQGIVGSQMTIGGRLNISPSISAPVSVQFVQPDGGVITTSVTTAADGTFTTNYTPVQTGDFKLRLAWGGNAGTYDAITNDFPFKVTGVKVNLTANKIDLVGVPLVPTTPDPSLTFSPTDAGTSNGLAVTVLNVIKWVPSVAPAGQYLRLNRDATFPGITAGQGYWMTPDRAVDLNPRGRLVDQTQPYSITLPTGWSTITSVFLQDINWGAAQVRYNGITRSIADAGDVIRPFAWGYNPNTGGYEAVGTSGVLRTGRGYWVRALVPCELILPAPGTRKAPGRAVEIANDGLQVSVRSGDRIDGDNFAPIDGTFKSRLAELEKPPYLADFVSVRFLSPGTVELPAGTRAATAGSQIIPFEVTTDRKNADITVQLPNLAKMGRKIEVTLVDITAKSTRAMGSNPGITYNSGESAAPRRFALVINQRTALSGLTITGTRVSGRSNGALNFDYVLSNSANVKAEITMANGRTIRELNGGRAATRGVNALQWDGRDSNGAAVPSGAYVLKLTATDDDGRTASAVLQVTLVR